MVNPAGNVFFLLLFYLNWNNCLAAQFSVGIWKAPQVFKVEKPEFWLSLCDLLAVSPMQPFSLFHFCDNETLHQRSEGKIVGKTVQQDRCQFPYNFSEYLRSECCRNWDEILMGMLISLYTLCRYIQYKKLVFHIMGKDCSILIKVTNKIRMYTSTTLFSVLWYNHHCNYVREIFQGIKIKETKYSYIYLPVLWL